MGHRFANKSKNLMAIPQPWLTVQTPIPIKNHGCKAKSIFRVGCDYIRDGMINFNILRRQLLQSIQFCPVLRNVLYLLQLFKHPLRTITFTSHLFRLSRLVCHDPNHILRHSLNPPIIFSLLYYLHPKTHLFRITRQKRSTLTAARVASIAITLAILLISQT